VEDRFNVQQVKQEQWSRAYVLPGNQQLKDSLQWGTKQMSNTQKEYKTVLKKALPHADTNDTNYIFLRFVVDFLPKGLVGLLIAIIFLAAWGSIAAALNSLASCTMIDFHVRFRTSAYDSTNTIQCAEEYRLSKYYTLGWGIFSVITAEFATGMGSLIEAVNVLGSLFYGVILGIFLVAFYLKKIRGNAVFLAAILGEIIVISFFFLDKYEIIGLGFLWLNVVGALSVVLLSILFYKLLPGQPVKAVS
jgi:Na+/proline symporter